MKKEIIVTALLLIVCFAGNTQELFRKGVWGTYTWGSPWDEADFTQKSYPYVKGAPIVLRWSELEPEPGNYQFEKLIGDKLRHANQEDFYTMLSIWVGPMSPKWIYESGVPLLEMEKTINPRGNVREWNFPYYLDEDYKKFFFRMIDHLGEYILDLPEDVRKRLVFVQSAEGSTGDGWPYKGKPLDLRYDINRDEWTSFRFATWKRYTDALSINGENSVPVLVNYDSCTDEEYEWLLNNMEVVGLKNGMFSHGYHISFGKTRLANWNDFKQKLAENNRQFFSRGEQDREWEIYGWSTQNPEQAFYWTAIYTTHNGLSMWNVPIKASKGARMKDAMEFFNRYANEQNPKTAKAAFCALRKGLDASDIVNYPEEQFGKAEMHNVSRYVKIAEAFKEYGAKQGDPEKAAGIVDLQILGDADESDTVAQASMTNAGMINRKRQDYNDVGWEILDGNYQRFITQIDSESTSYGWWHKGPEKSVYSRFARSTDSKKGNRFYFDVNDECKFDGAIALRLVWLDEGTAKWQIKYNGTDSPEAIAFTNLNSNSGEWKEKTIEIPDAKFSNSGAKSSDIIIENISENEAIVFHLIEIITQKN
ncbi:MAG: hypothetical protein WD577_11265 [Bacteroidales bacterium]